MACLIACDVSDRCHGPGSFRDPAGFVFRRGGVLYRQVNQSYAPTFDRLEKTGFLAELQNDGLLVRHEQLGGDHGSTIDALAVLRPDIVPFISYPYEWCLRELRDAALLTLELQRRALDAGFILRDASAYNVQFIGGYPGSYRLAFIRDLRRRAAMAGIRPVLRAFSRATRAHGRALSPSVFQVDASGAHTPHIETRSDNLRRQGPARWGWTPPHPRTPQEENGWRLGKDDACDSPARSPWPH